MNATATRRHSRRSYLFVLAIFAGLLLLPTWGAAQEDTTSTTAADGQAELIQLGYDTFSANCQACHQAGGVGVEGSFPPLLDNPNVQDPEYIRTTVRNGKQGPITVNGVDYNGQMPAFTSLSEDEIDGLIAYIQSGFQTPVVPDGGGSELPVATGALPELAGMAIVAAFALAVAAVAFVLGPRIVGPIDRVTVPWLDAWLRAGIIVVFFVGATVVLPSVILKSEVVGSLARPVQDIIGSGLWLGGLAAGLLGLWYAQREKRV